MLIDMTEHGSYHPYGPLGLPFNAQSPQPHLVQIPYIYRGGRWQLVPKKDQSAAKPNKVSGAKLTSCGVELLKIVDVEPLPAFTDKLKKHFSRSGYQMVRSRLLVSSLAVSTAWSGNCA